MLVIQCGAKVRCIAVFLSFLWKISCLVYRVSCSDPRRLPSTVQIGQLVKLKGLTGGGFKIGNIGQPVRCKQL
jgi:hypothetical protein